MYRNLLRIVCSLLGLCLFQELAGQAPYHRSFGNPTEEALLFLHGGPGYNSANFEITTAQRLSEQGFFVICYDRRGEGRSKALDAAFTFAETFQDILALLDQYDVEKVHLLGHSFGGIVGTLFADQYPEITGSLILIGAPVVFQETLKNVIARSRAIYEEKQDQVNLNYMNMLENMDTSSMAYSSYCFMHAFQNGFYSPKNPSQEAQDLYKLFQTDSTLKTYGSEMTYPPPQGFWENEQYTTLDLREKIQGIQAKQLPIYGLYGEEDGLFSEKQIEKLEELLGRDQFSYLPNCSHTVFIDQQSLFLETLGNWLK